MNRTKLNTLFFIIPYSIIFLIIISLTSVLEVSILIVYFYVLSIIFINSQNNLADPRGLLLGFLLLYSTFYPLQIYLLDLSLLPINYEVVKDSLYYQFIGIVTFVITSSYVIDKNSNFNIKDLIDTRDNNVLSEKIIFIVLIPIVVFSLLLILSSGATSKREVLDGGSILNTLSMFSILIMTVIAILRAVRLNNGYFKDIRLLFFIFLCLSYMLITGERDIFFRIVFIAILIYFDKYRNSNFTVIITILLLVIFLVPISQAFKSVLLSGEITISRQGLELILSNEFLSASRNFYSILLFGFEQSIDFLLNDILRAFVPSTFLSGIDIQSTNSWFNKVFRVNNNFSGTAGWGFSIMGSGYLTAGIPGIVLVMFIYSYIISKLYNLRSKSIYWYAFYLLAFSTAIYVIRADLANYFSQIFKIGGLSVLVVYISSRIIQK